jgi:predicted transposase/invertase (TIGR01784 family)
VGTLASWGKPKSTDKPPYLRPMTPTLRQVHDRFFKEAFSRTEVVVDFIQAYLPPDFTNQLDLTSLARLSDSHVDQKLAQHYVDMLFSVKYGEHPITIALLLEHKSYPEKHPHFQLNRYLLNNWEDQVKAKKSLQPVVPVLIYHGETRWQQQPMRSYFPTMTDELSQFLPSFNYLFIDLTQQGNDAALASNYAKLTAGLLRTIRHKERLAAMLEELSAVVAQLAEDAPGQRFIQTVLLYIGQGSKLKPVEIIAIFRSISRKTEQLVMSAFETLIEQGVQQGVQQGIREGMQQGIREGMQQGIREGMQQATLQHIKGLLRLNLDATAIAAAFDMPLETVKAYIKQIQSEKTA